MDLQIAKVLIEKKLLKEEMEVTANYYGPDLSGINTVLVKNDFFIQKIQCINDKYIFLLRSTKDGTLKKVGIDGIESIEGMPPSRYAACYNIKSDGTGPMHTKKKRGRKPKNTLALLNKIETN